LFMNGVAYWLLVRALIKRHGHDSEFASRIGSDFKGNISPALYVIAVAMAFVNVWFSLAIYAGVAAMWVIPDRRFER
jgi:uncharacterized membrane protein